MRRNCREAGTHATRSGGREEARLCECTKAVGGAVALHMVVAMRTVARMDGGGAERPGERLCRCWELAVVSHSPVTRLHV